MVHLADPGQMNAVKEAFHVSSSPPTIVCRDAEQMQIFEFCKTCIEQETGGSLYVCGCPGTGKTLSMEKVKELLVAWTKEASPILFFHRLQSFSLLVVLRAVWLDFVPYMCALVARIVFSGGTDFIRLHALLVLTESLPNM